jgi:hypothetical protein
MTDPRHESLADAVDRLLDRLQHVLTDDQKGNPALREALIQAYRISVDERHSLDQLPSEFPNLNLWWGTR